MDRIAARRALRHRVGQCSDETFSKCTERGACVFDAPYYGTGGSYWPLVISGEIGTIFLPNTRVYISAHGMGTPMNKGDVLGRK